jgi:hypothetical protein
MVSCSSCEFATSISATCEYRLWYEPSLKWSCRRGISLVTGTEFPESLFAPMSGVSLEGVLEWPSELWLKEDPDCLESRPPAIVSLCSSMLKEGIEGCRAVLDTGLRCWELLARSNSGRCASACGGIGGNALNGASAII